MKVLTVVSEYPETCLLLNHWGRTGGDGGHLGWGDSVFGRIYDDCVRGSAAPISEADEQFMRVDNAMGLLRATRIRVYVVLYGHFACGLAPAQIASRQSIGETAVKSILREGVAWVSGKLGTI